MTKSEKAYKEHKAQQKFLAKISALESDIKKTEMVCTYKGMKKIEVVKWQNNSFI
jgi:hypothetical protein